MSWASLAGKVARLALRRKKSTSNSYFPKYEKDPIGFIYDVLGLELYDRQKEIAISFRDNRLTAVKGCFSCGKSFLGASLCLWRLYSLDPSMVITVAPNLKQVVDAVWKDINTIFVKTPLKLAGKPGVAFLKIAPDRFAKGFPATNDSVQGYHIAKNPTLLVDEAGLLDSTKFESLGGLLSADNPSGIMLGNPNDINTTFSRYFDPSDPLYDMAESFTISALELPTVTGVGPQIPGLATKEWVDDMEAKYGKDSPMYIRFVLGEFYQSEESVVIPEDWARDALQTGLKEDLEERYHEFTKDSKTVKPVDEALYLGVDIGRNRDQTVFAFRKGRLVWIEDAFNGDSRKVCDRLQVVVSKYSPDYISIDSTGLGVSVKDMIVERVNRGQMSFGTSRVEYIDYRHSAFNKKDFFSVLSEMQWAMREWMDPVGSGPWAIIPNKHGRQLAKELSYRQFDYDRDRRIIVESKKKMIARCGKSPDFADAIMTTFYIKNNRFVIGFI